jgi:cysteine desulfurase
MRPAAVAAYAAAAAAAGNASSLHASGRRARRAVEEARETVAATLDARPSEVVFTAGGTESDNMAVKGMFWRRRDDDPRRRRVLVSSVEHLAVLDAVRWLADSQGAEIELLEVDATGKVCPETLRAALAVDPASVALVSVMWANNEVGTISQVAELAAVAHAAGVPLHTDAVQAAGSVPISFAASGVDAMTVSGHKLGGPYGVGALLVRRGLDLTPLTHGGGQERDVRSGSLDVPGIAAFSVALSAAVCQQPAEAERLADLRDDLVRRVIDAVPDAVLNGAAPGPGRLPGNAHFSFPGCEGDSLLMLLDARGIECSTGSACSAGIAQPSHVMLAMGADAEAARGSLRFTLGHCSSAADVDDLVGVIAGVTERARRAGELAAASG